MQLLMWHYEFHSQSLNLLCLDTIEVTASDQSLDYNELYSTGNASQSKINYSCVMQIEL